MTKPDLNIRIEISRFFVKALKYLQKKYPHITEDVQSLIGQLEQGDTPGDQMPSVQYRVYKVRLSSSDQAKGKRGGYRIIYYVKTADRIFLITIYAKAQQTDMSASEIRRMIDEIEGK